MSRQVWKGSTLLNPEPPVLVSCGSPEKPNLITVGWTGTICTQPPMLSISVRPERYSHHLIKESGEFVVNLPTESLVRAIDWCGVKSGRDVDKFADVKGMARATNGVYYLPYSTNAFVSGKVTQEIDLGTHTLFIADVTEARVLSDAPSMTYSFYFANVKPKPSALKKQTGWVCKICGYVYEGEALPADFICPLCKHGAEDFEKLPE